MPIERSRTGSVCPLVIDQPEGNLDNKSVYENMRQVPDNSKL